MTTDHTRTFADLPTTPTRDDYVWIARYTNDHTTIPYAAKTARRAAGLACHKARSDINEEETEWSEHTGEVYVLDSAADVDLERYQESVVVERHFIHDPEP